LENIGSSATRVDGPEKEDAGESKKTGREDKQENEKKA